MKEIVFIMENNLSLGIIGADYIYEATVKVKRKPILNKKSHATYMGFTLIRRDVFEKVGGFMRILAVARTPNFALELWKRQITKLCGHLSPFCILKDWKT